MRIVTLILLVLLATVAYAQRPADATAVAPNVNSATETILVSQPDVLSNTTERSRDSTPLTSKLLRSPGDRGTCFFIRSYVMKREDDTDAMHLDHVTTCTPMSRFQMKKTVRVVPAIER